MAVIDTLKSSDLFKDLAQKYLEKLAHLCIGRNYKEGETIFQEGSKATELYVLTDGRVALEMSIRPVPERSAIPTAVEVINKGEAFGWSAVVEPYQFTLSARCLTNCTVLAIKGDMLLKIMAEDTELGYELMKRIAGLISLRLTYTRLRLTSGLGLVLLGREMGSNK